MAKSKKQKQKKLAAKRGKKVIKKKRALAQAGPASLMKGFSDAGRFPVHESLVSTELFDGNVGMCTAILSRKLPAGHIAAGVFMIDLYCLGVKNADARIFTTYEYREYIALLEQRHNFREIEAPCLVKLVQSSVDYARDLGLLPHNDYRKAHKIFGDIDAATCATEYTFGKDGKPFYIAGPYDSPLRIKQIVDQLTKRLGPDGFEVVIPMGNVDDFGDEAD